MKSQNKIGTSKYKFSHDFPFSIASVPETVQGKTKSGNGVSETIKKYSVVEIETMLKTGTIEIGDSEVNLKKRKRMSDVWEHFYPLRNATTKVNIPRWYICMDCKTPIENTYTDSTTIMFKRHQNKCKSSKDQPKLLEFLSDRKPIKLKEADGKMLLDASIRFIVEDDRSYMAIEGNGLKQLVIAAVKIGQLNPNLQPMDVEENLPSRVTVQRNIERRIPEIKAMMISKIHEAMELSGSIACTSDMWTDRYKQTSYMSLTCHISRLTESNIVYERFLIGFMEVDEDNKTHEVVQQYLFDKLNECGISNEQISSNVYFVTDRGSNFKAIRGIERLNCAAHLLNNVVQVTVIIKRLK